MLDFGRVKEQKSTEIKL